MLNSVEDAQCSGRSSTRTDETVAQVNELTHQNRHLTICGTYQHILTDELNMKWIAAKFVPYALTDDQKQQYVIVCRILQEQVQSDPTFLSKSITGYETWVYGYDPKTENSSPPSGKILHFHA
jgi:hypothetical protein